jgi:hypothetical protein
MEEMPVLLKDWPENVGHRKHDACIADVWEGSFQLLLPELRGSVPTTRTGSRLAGVGNEFLFSF